MAIPPPGARDGSTAVYDPVRNRMVVFGGDDHTFFPPRETWALALDGSGWSSLNLGGFLPQGRTDHSAIYDPVRDRMVVFGGYVPCVYAECAVLNDVVALSFSGHSNWSPLDTEGIQPSGRTGHTAIYDPVRDRMIVFGGAGDSEVWALSLAGNPTWTLLDPTGTPPSPRAEHTAIYDPVGDRMVIFGGTWGFPANDDVWELTLAGTPVWRELSPSGAPPPGRRAHSASYDPVRNCMTVFGGVGDDGAARHDAWRLSLAEVPEWIELSPDGVPPSRANHAAVYDPLGDRVVVFAGWRGVGNPPTNDTWSLSLAGGSAWLEFASGGPGMLADHSAIYDPVRDRMIVFGGRPYSPVSSIEVWSLSFAGTPGWTLLDASGPRPPSRSAQAAIYDPIRDRMVIFGGEGPGAFYADAWALSLGGNMAWSQLGCCSVGPAPRSQPSAIYDPLRDRMVVFGGFSGVGTFNDVWALPFSGSQTWIELAPGGVLPAARYGHTATYDPWRDRMMMFGGSGGDDDVWVLSLTEAPAWSAFSPESYPALPRAEHSAVYDPLRDRIVVYAGHDSGPSDDTFSLDLGASLVWSVLSPAGDLPARRKRHSAIYDPQRDRMVVFGGESRTDTWALTWGLPVDVPAMLDHGRLHGIIGSYPNPARGTVVFEIQLSGTQRYQTLAIFNVQGQVVDRVDLGGLRAGIHRVHWQGKSRAGERVPSGIYFARLDAAPGSQVRRFVLID